MTEIVVGLDLSEPTEAALRWAADQAQRTGLPLRGVHAAQLPYRPVFGGTSGIFALNQEPQLPDDYRQAVIQVWNQVEPRPGWRLQFFLGEPGPVLTAQAADAALLVVGTQFHLGLGRVFPGSVSHYCLTHCKVPVVAVPAVTEASSRPSVVDETAYVEITDPDQAHRS